MVSLRVKPSLGARLSGHPINQGLIARWMFNEGGGLNVYDLSGRNNTGVLTNMAFPATASSGWGVGNVGRCLLFDQTDDAVSINGATFPSIGNTLTYSCWAILRAQSQGYTLFAQNNVASAFQFGVQNTLNVRAFINGASIAATAGSVFALNAWVHFVYTRNGTGSGTHAIYVNGRSIALVTDVATSYADTTTNKLIGMRTTSGNVEGWLGSIDNVSMWNRALSASEVWALYQQPFIGVLTGRPNRHYVKTTTPPVTRRHFLLTMGAG